MGASLLLSSGPSDLAFLESAAPIGSISSMEVNVDTLEQVEFIDLGDQDGADVFLPCEDPPPTPQTSGMSLSLGLGHPLARAGSQSLRESASLGQGKCVFSGGWKWAFQPVNSSLWIFGKLNQWGN